MVILVFRGYDILSWTLLGPEYKQASLNTQTHTYTHNLKR